LGRLHWPPNELARFNVSGVATSSALVLGEGRSDSQTQNRHNGSE
jgi:hypothetical protein